jgi:hypothetical protein
MQTTSKRWPDKPAWRHGAPVVQANTRTDQQPIPRLNPPPDIDQHFGIAGKSIIRNHRIFS